MGKGQRITHHQGPIPEGYVDQLIHQMPGTSILDEGGYSTVLALPCGQLVTKINDNAWRQDAWIAWAMVCLGDRSKCPHMPVIGNLVFWDNAYMATMERLEPLVLVNDKPSGIESRAAMEWYEGILARWMGKRRRPLDRGRETVLRRLDATFRLFDRQFGGYARLDVHPGNVMLRRAENGAAEPVLTDPFSGYIIRGLEDTNERTAR